MRTPGRPFWAVLVAGLVALALASAVAAGATTRERGRLAEQDRQNAAAAAQLFARLVAHLQGSGGDPRFAERIQAAPDLVDEASSAAAIARAAGRIEEPRLIRAETRRVRQGRSGGAEVTTREYWVTRIISVEGTVLDTRSDVVEVTYLVRRAAGGWDVVAWDLAAPGADEGAE